MSGVCLQCSVCIRGVASQPQFVDVMMQGRFSSRDQDTSFRGLSSSAAIVSCRERSCWSAFRSASENHSMAAEKQSTHYADKGVQTDDDSFRTLLSSPSFSAVSTPVYRHSPTTMTGSVATSNHTYPSVMLDNTFGQGLQSDEDDFGSNDETSPSHSISSITRAYKRQHLPFSRPAGLVTLKHPSSRIVSLPETTPAYSVKTVLDKTTPRVVSMPLPSVQSPPSDQDDFNEYSREETSFFFRHGYPSCTTVLDHFSEAPHTPSPPSSPDSVVIIANKDQLSEEFLRNRAQNEEHQSNQPDDEGLLHCL